MPPATFNHVLRNIEQFAAEIARQQTTCRLGVGFVVTRDNYRELKDAIALAKRLGADNIRISAAFTTEGADYHHPHADEVRAVIADQREIHQNGFTIYNNFGDRVEDLEGKHPDYGFCPIMNLQTYVAGDGNVYTCCINAYNLRGKIGSFLERGFKRLWDSEAKQAFFREFNASECPACMYNPKNHVMNTLIAGPAVQLPAAPPPEHVEFV